MPQCTLGTRSSFVLLALCFFLAGCGTSRQTVCNAAAGSTCCGPSPLAACPVDAIPLLYATTSSNQILGFSISTSGALTALPPTAGPANSRSVGAEFNNLVFADTSTNSVDSFSVDLAQGDVTSIQGSPFSLGTTNGGPTSIVLSTNDTLYASEPDGTIVGIASLPVGGGMFATPLAGSPFSAGVAPAQMAFATTQTTSVLYASDPGDATGGILAYLLDFTGSLTPIQGSPFPTLPGANPGFVFQGIYSAAGAQTQFILVSLTSAEKVAVFAVGSDGGLTAVPGSPFSVGNAPATIAEDDQNHVFVLNGGDHTVSAFNLASNGVLSPIGTVSVGTATGGMTLWPNNGLFVPDNSGSEIWSLKINSNGTLTQAGSPLVLTNPPQQLTFVGPPFPLN